MLTDRTEGIRCSSFLCFVGSSFDKSARLHSSCVMQAAKNGPSATRLSGFDCSGMPRPSLGNFLPASWLIAPKVSWSTPPPLVRLLSSSLIQISKWTLCRASPLPPRARRFSGEWPLCALDMHCSGCSYFYQVWNGSLALGRHFICIETCRVHQIRVHKTVAPNHTLPLRCASMKLVLAWPSIP